MSGKDSKGSSVPNLLDLISNDAGIQKLVQGIQDTLAGAARGLTVDTVGAPVDILASAMNALGIPVGNKAVGGSAWMRELLDQPADESGAGLAGNLLSAITSPGKLATDAAMLAPMLGGIMMGPKSKLWSKEGAEYAEAMLPHLTDSGQLQELFRYTNTFRSPGDKKLRQELSDQAAELRRMPAEGVARLEEVLDHPELYKAYPFLRNMRVSDMGETTGNASFTAPSLFTDGLMQFNRQSPTAKTDLLHEIQHAVQHREGFARGGNISGMYGTPEFEQAKKLTKGNLSDEAIARILYGRLSGEAEARLVETRAGFSPEDLKQFFPAEFDYGLTAYDVPLDKLINRFYK